MTENTDGSYYDGIEAAAQLVDKWAKSYPASIFIEPPAGEHGQTVDACSAAALRAALPRIAEEIRALVDPADMAYRALIAAAEKATEAVELAHRTGTWEEFQEALYGEETAWTAAREEFRCITRERAREELTR